MNIAQIVKTMHKLKAGMAAIIGDNEELLCKTKELYYTNSTIYSCAQEQTDLINRNKFIEFLDIDWHSQIKKFKNDNNQTELDKIDHHFIAK